MNDKTSPPKTWTLREAREHFFTDEDRADWHEFERQREVESQHRSDELQKLEWLADEKSGDLTALELNNFIGKDLKEIGAMSPHEIQAAIKNGIPYEPYGHWFLSRAEYLKGLELSKHFSPSDYEPPYADIRDDYPNIRSLVKALREGKAIAYGSMDQHHRPLKRIESSRWHGAWSFNLLKNTAKSLDKEWLTFFHLEIAEAPTPSVATQDSKPIEIVKEPAPSETAPEATPKRLDIDRGGAPRKYAWEEYDRAFFVDLEKKGIPETKHEGALMYEDCARTLKGKVPSLSAIKHHLRTKHPELWETFRKA